MYLNAENNNDEESDEEKEITEFTKIKVNKKKNIKSQIIIFVPIMTYF